MTLLAKEQARELAIFYMRESAVLLDVVVKDVTIKVMVKNNVSCNKNTLRMKHSWCLLSLLH